MIKLINSTSEFKSWRSSHQGEIALVPTMGNLHRGHVSLAAEAAQSFDTVVVTIFVNPKQFGPNEDFDRYPRTLDDDLAALKDIDANIVVFAPQDPAEIYPTGFASEIAVPSLAGILCGKSRPTHFAGVTTVVYQLLALTRPNTAYFGLKDYQQFKIIERMTIDLHLPVKIVGMPIIRDHDGLALSSRNRYLSNEERAHALELPMTLDKAKAILLEGGLEACQKFLDDTKRKLGWDYLDARNAQTLQAAHANDNLLLLAGALFVGTTRLIDNRVVEINVR